MKDIRILAGAGTLLCLGIGLCTYIHIETTEIAQSKKATMIAIDDLKQAHVTLADAVNQRQLGAVQHYDDIKRASIRLRSLDRHFDASLFPEDFVDNGILARITEYKSQSDGKLEGVEAYKQAHSVVENAQTIMARLSHELLINALETNRLALAAKVSDTDWNVARYVQSKGSAYGEEIKTLMPVVNEYSAGLNELMRQQVSDYLSQISEMMARFEANTQAVALANRFTELQLLDGIGDSYIDYIDAQSGRLKNLRTISIAAVLVILAGLIAFAIKLYQRVKAHRSALAQAETAQANYTGRTEQLFATEPLIAFGETVSATVNELADPLTQTTQYLNRLAASAQSCDPVFTALGQLQEQADLPVAKRNKATINTVFNDMMRAYRAEICKEVLPQSVISKAIETAANASTLVTRLLNYKDMAASTRVPLPLTQLINDELSRVNVIDTVTVERYMVDLPKVLLNPVAIKEALKDLLDVGLHHINHCGRIAVTTSVKHDVVEANFRFVLLESLINDDETFEHTMTHDTELLVSFERIADSIKAQGGQLSTEGFIDNHFTVSLEFAPEP